MVLLLNKIEVIHTYFYLCAKSTCLLKVYHSGIEIVVLLLYVNSGSRKKHKLYPNQLSISSQVLKNSRSYVYNLPD